MYQKIPAKQFPKAERNVSKIDFKQRVEKLHS